MKYDDMKARVFADGYHVAFYSKEPVGFALADTKIYAVHEHGYCWTGLVSLDEREARWTIEHNQFSGITDAAN